MSSRSLPTGRRLGLSGSDLRVRRERSATLAAGSVGGGLLLLAAGRHWLEVRAHGGLPLPPLGLSGRRLAPGVPALALVALAGAGGLLAARGVLRQVVGAALAAAGAGACWLVVARGLLPAAHHHAVVLAATSLAGADSYSVVGSGWPAIALVAAVLILGAGTYAVLCSGQWSALGVRFDAPGGTGAELAATNRPMPRPRTDWESLDRGEDPTSAG